MPSGPPQLVTKWKSFLHRENIEDIKNIHVCLKHFHDEDVETYFVIPQPDGTNLEVKRTVPRLHRDAVPKFLPGCPSYLSVLTKTQTRFDHCAKERDQLDVAITLSLKQQQKDEERFKVSTLCELNSKVNNLTLPEDWLLCYLGMNQLHFIKPSISNENGAQYHISFCQILESERRLKLSSILKFFQVKVWYMIYLLKNLLIPFQLHNSSYGTFPIIYTRIFVN